MTGTTIRQSWTPLILLNTSIITSSPGVYKIFDISADYARSLVQGKTFIKYDPQDHSVTPDRGIHLISAIGHKSTAEALSAILGVEVPVDRTAVKQEHGQQALVFKLRARTEEGRILSLPELEEIGYDLQLLDRIQ